MKKITFILGSMGRGGAERVISILSRSYAERGYQTDIIVLLSNEVGYELHPSTRVIDFSGNTASRIKRLPYWIKSIRGYVKENKPDVVVAFAARVNLIVINALTGLNTKLIVSERNDPRHDGRSFLVDILVKLQYPSVNAVVFQTKRAKSCFKNLKNSVIIPNPITVNTYSHSVDKNKVVSVGRLTAQKNHNLLLEAFADVSKKFPLSYLEIYGKGELENDLRNKINKLGLKEKVFLQGNVNDVHTRISDAAVFCLTSDYEGLSNAFLEAMMMGIPCVSTNCAGADEYIRNGENGFLVNIGDKQQLVFAIEKLLANEELRNIFSSKAIKELQTVTSENIIKRWDKLIL